MEYLEFFKLGSEPFSNAPMSRFYYGSHQHSEALRRLQYVASSMKGLAICVGDIGHGKTTLARRMLDSLPESQYEAAMLVIVHAGITANWLLKRIASQLGVEQPADDKLAILSQLYNRLLEIHSQGKRAVVLIDEAQMLSTRELMEEFRGLLNLEVPEHKLITFIFFGLPELENNLRLDPPLAQRIALRYHLRPLTVADTTAYIQHRLRVAGAAGPLFPPELMPDIHRLTGGVPRLINTLCDNLLLEMYFERRQQATREMVGEAGRNLGLPEDPNAPPPVMPPPVDNRPAVEGSEGHDAIAVVDRKALAEAVAASQNREAEIPPMDPASIAAQVAGEPFESTSSPSHLAEDVPAYDGPMEPISTVQPTDEGPSEQPSAADLSDPLSYLSAAPVDEFELEPSAPEQSLDYLDIEVVEEGSALGLETPATLPEFGADESPHSVPTREFSPPVPQSVASAPPPSVELPLENRDDTEDELPPFEAASTLEPSPATRGEHEVEVSPDDVEVEAYDDEALDSPVEAELVAEVDEDREEAPGRVPPPPSLPPRAAAPSSFETEITQEFRPTDMQMGEEPSEDIQVTRIEARPKPEREPEPQPEPAASPEAPSAPQSSASTRTVTTSTGSTIDLNEIDNLLADINSSIGRK